MKKVILILSILFVADLFAMSVKQFKPRKIASVANNYPQLEFLELRQFPTKTKYKFDLSGLVKDEAGTVYAISDKEKYPFIYTVNWQKGKLYEYTPLSINDQRDIEAVDVCGNTFYVTNEKNNKIYAIKKGEQTKALDIDLSQQNLGSSFFDGNSGFEGLAVDCATQTMYALKEMFPRYILTIDMKTGKVVKNWNIPANGGLIDDFNDAKFENGFLYILERSPMFVTKVDVKTGKVIQKYSYEHMEKGPGYLFGPSSNNMGEALMLTKNEIWIGFDNNGRKSTKDSQKELGLVGRDPLIMRFKRPENF